MISAQIPAKPAQKIKLPDASPPFFLRVLVTALLMFFLFGISIAISLYSKEFNSPPPTNFESCRLAKGSMIEESYPEVCVTKKGLRFTREISSREKVLLETTENGVFCGGIAGILCPEGYTCEYDGNYPDASGTCKSN